MSGERLITVRAHIPAFGNDAARAVTLEASLFQAHESDAAALTEGAAYLGAILHPRIEPFVRFSIEKITPVTTLKE